MPFTEVFEKHRLEDPDVDDLNPYEILLSKQCHAECCNFFLLQNALDAS